MKKLHFIVEATMEDFMEKALGQLPDESFEALGDVVQKAVIAFVLHGLATEGDEPAGTLGSLHLHFRIEERYCPDDLPEPNQYTIDFSQGWDA